VRYRTDTCTIEAPTVPKQIDRGTACPLGRGPEVLCGVRLIIIINYISQLYIINAREDAKPPPKLSNHRQNEKQHRNRVLRIRLPLFAMSQPGRTEGASRGDGESQNHGTDRGLA